MNVKLDVTDRTILQALEEDARSSIADIAKKTHIQRDVVQYRIKRMREQKIISHISPICDTNKMGFPIYSWINVQLQQIDEKIEQQFRSYLIEHPNIVYVAKVTGYYHYAFTIAAKNITHFDKILRDVVAQFPNLIKTYNTSLLVEEVQYDSFYKLIDQ